MSQEEFVNAAIIRAVHAGIEPVGDAPPCESHLFAETMTNGKECLSAIATCGESAATAAVVLRGIHKIADIDAMGVAFANHVRIALKTAEDAAIMVEQARLRRYAKPPPLPSVALQEPKP